TDPGTLPHLAADGWDEQSVEAVSEQDSLPALCLLSRRADPRLALRLTEPSAGTLAAVVVERGVVRATVGESGQQTYHASLVLTRLTADHLDVEFPAAVASLDLKALLDGKAVAWKMVDAAGQESDNGTVARLQIGPDL